MPRPMFLRCKTAADLRQNAAGLIKAIEQGESIRAEDLTRFTRATLNKTTEQLDSADWADLSSAIDTVIATNLMSSSDSVKIGRASCRESVCQNVYIMVD